MESTISSRESARPTSLRRCLRRAWCCCTTAGTFHTWNARKRCATHSPTSFMARRLTSEGARGRRAQLKYSGHDVATHHVEWYRGRPSFGCYYALVHVQLWSPALQPPLHRAEKARGDEAVQDAMVEGERHVHHVADGDGVVDHDGPLDDRIHRENTRVGLIDDRHRDERAEHAGVIHRKRRALQVGGHQLVGARAGGEVA